MSLSDEVESTTCYKCERDIIAYVGEVHPLCVSCDDDFEDWLRSCLN